MKILVVGATGSIGGSVFRRCLAHPAVTEVVAFVRRELPPEVATLPKLRTVVVSDFSSWSEDVLQAEADADAMLWMMGTYEASEAVDHDYPLIFQEAFARVIESTPGRSKFRCIYLSGAFVVQDQDKPLWFLDTARKLKGRFEIKAIEFAQQHSESWRTYIVAPGGIVPEGMIGGSVATALLGKTCSIKVEELGAFMVYLAVGGEEEGIRIENPRLVEKGRELLAAAVVPTTS